MLGIVFRKAKINNFVQREVLKLFYLEPRGRIAYALFIRLYCKTYLTNIDMAQIIKQFRDGSVLEYDKGNFDDWCVYLTRPNVPRYAPRDFQYFERLSEYASAYGPNKVYEDFVAIYQITTKSLEVSVLERIEEIASSYGNNYIDVAIDFTIIYMGMIAEENKKFTKLGKRVKRLGVYQVLQEGMPSNQAANFSRGMTWREIDAKCRERGF